MNPTLDAFLRSWPSNPLFAVSLALTGAIYARGWSILRRRDPDRWHGGRLAAFLGGLAALYLALASPIESFASLLLSMHMLQHLLLMMAAPPLVWLGAPAFPLLCGLPASLRESWIGPLARSRPLHRLFRRLTHPLVALPVFVAATWLWHIPAAYEGALRWDALHYFEHACFLTAGLLFWYPVVRPYPSRPGWSLWLLVPYLILADVQNTVLSALFTFSSRPLYAYYTEVPSLPGLSPLKDQAAAGLLMWVPGSLVFLVPLFAMSVQLLYSREQRRTASAVPSRTTRGRVQPGRRTARRDRVGFDLLRVPVVGRFLRWQHARVALQVPLAILAGLLILDGFRGPPVAPMNLAGVLPWIHWRGLLILGLLAGGNFFCMACPFTLPRRLAGRWLGQGRNWPRWLSTKWLAVVLLSLFLWAYEAFSLWDRPSWTAWIAVGYFVAAFAVDAFFRGGTFCKYVCPIGQFNFAQSLLSPLEVKVRSPDVCASCQTHDCIGGRGTIPGCQSRLYQPHKSSNMDCTFCLDCVHACPHDNVGLLAVLPGRQLWHDAPRSGIGRFARRPDLAALVVVLVFGALANAAGMVAPVLEWQDQLGSTLGHRPQWLITGLLAIGSFIMVPITAVGTAAFISRRWARLAIGPLETATRFSFALLPLGFGMWLAHYSFHFFTSWETIIPASQRLVQDLGGTFLGEPRYLCACCRPVGDGIVKLELLFLDAGLLMSLYAAYRIARAQASGLSRAIKAAAPWSVVILLLFVTAVWIVFQPMQMRGTLGGGA